jgi:hypothetical protein
MESEGARKSTRSTILYKQYSGTEWESRKIQDGYRKVDISLEPGLCFAGVNSGACLLAKWIQFSNAGVGDQTRNN